jgi:hypothetical protein
MAMPTPNKSRKTVKKIVNKEMLLVDDAWLIDDCLKKMMKTTQIVMQQQRKQN